MDAKVHAEADNPEPESKMKYDLEVADKNGGMSDGDPPPVYTPKTETANGVVKVEVKDGKDSKEKKKVEMVGMLEVFRYATKGDRALIILGLIFALIHGGAMPGMIIVFGEMTDTFVDNAYMDNFLEEYVPKLQQICAVMFANASWCYENITVDALKDEAELKRVVTLLNMTEELDKLANTSMDDFTADMTRYCIYYAVIGVGVIIMGYGQMATWNTTAYNQAQCIRTTLFKAILRQEIGWFDTHEVGELNTRLSDDVSKMEAGLGEKLALFFQWFSGFLVGFAIGFVYGWKLTLVIVAVSPLLALSGGIMAKLGSSFTSAELAAYSKAGAVAEEVLGSIRTVTAFSGQDKEVARYDIHLKEAQKFGIKKGTINGTAMGIIFLIMFASYGLAFWYGSQLVRAGEYTAGKLLIVFFGVLIGAFSLGNAAPNIQEFSVARGAAHIIFRIIDQVPSIDSRSTTGIKKESLVGNIEFKNVHFNYPSRSEVNVLQGLSLKASVGETVALVGSSGCGKSTTVQLLQRFYDPQDGVVEVDGVDVREYNVSWLRQQVGVVSQEPVLFATTIQENIEYGREGISMDDIIAACRMANAHDFIVKLPQQYKTLVGERGAQLSGGQKQRIAIARALVRDPRILLLDEATSALDTESEASVQSALDKARMGRTTIVIAHRLSTVRTADLIVGVSDGQAVEKGTHDELMAQGGIYQTLVTNQQYEEEEVDLQDAQDTELERGMSGRGSKKGLQRGTSSVNAHGLHSVVSVNEEEEKLPDPSVMRIMGMNKPEWWLIVIGCFCAICTGAVQPAFAVVFSDILGVFAITDLAEQEYKSNLYSGMFVVIGIAAGIAMFGQSYCFSTSGEALTMRLRQMTFRTLLQQEISYFDDHKNSTGALCTRLATDASAVQGATGARLATFCQSIASIGTGIVIGFMFSWELTLLIIGFVPLMMIAGIVQMKVIAGNKGENAKAQEGAGKVAVESIENMRTVATLTKEEKFYQDYCKKTSIPFKQNRQKAHLQGLAYGFSQGIIFFAYAACFYLGAWLIMNRGLEFQNMFKVLMAIVFGALAAGQASSFAPDYGKAKISAAKIFALFDRVPSIDSFSKEGSVLDPNHVNGSVELRNVQFTYPSRPDIPVLRGLSIIAKPGQTVALVGSSGCGKSTTVSLLERFYDPLVGEVCIDGQDTRTINIQSLRGQIGIVSQEPVLFGTSIKDNIAYGDNTREVPMAEIIQAAREANIHSFIDELPLGYETDVGDKGAQLSGGQKQRVAIARALVRNPKILLLDEATSALDTESEKIVQEALDKAQEGRTCLVIAHRLSTIRNADVIVVIHNGRVSEIGTHNELLQQRGIYHRLNNTQANKL